MLAYEGDEPTVHWGLHTSSVVDSVRTSHFDLQRQHHVFDGFKPLSNVSFADPSFEERLTTLPFHKPIEDVTTD
jgi:hypothetical protein